MMVVNMRKNFKLSQEGQALIEFIVFLPLMFTLYSVISGFAGAINGSINQQKVSRAYFYYRLQNNSTIPKPSPDNAFMAWQRFGMFYIGWKDYFKNQATPVMPCYQVSIPMKLTASDACENAYTQTKTMYVRVGTVYGFCGATFRNIDQQTHYVPDNRRMSYQELVDPGSCLITR